VTNKTTAVTELLADLPNTGKGKIAEQKQTVRPIVLVGNTIELIRKNLQPDESFFIDNEMLYIIKTGDSVSSYIPIVSAETGLLNTPEREQKKVTFSTMINPAIRLAGSVDLRSVNAQHLNGIYNVRDITYNGDYNGQDWNMAIMSLANG
jgi:hypothetical protein